MPDIEKRVIALLVDDDEDDRDFFCEALGTISPNMICLTAKDGMDALDLLQKSTELPEFIFLDLNMPRMGGKQCLRELKQHKRFSHIPVIMYSTSLMDIDMRELMALGAADYIKKPVFFEEIKTALAEIILK